MQAIHWAAFSGQQNVMIALIEEHGVDPQEKTEVI